MSGNQPLVVCLYLEQGTKNLIEVLSAWEILN